MSLIHTIMSVFEREKGNDKLCDQQDGYSVPLNPFTLQKTIALVLVVVSVLVIVLIIIYISVLVILFVSVLTIVSIIVFVIVLSTVF